MNAKKFAKVTMTDPFHSICLNGNFTYTMCCQPQPRLVLTIVTSELRKIFVKAHAMKILDFLLRRIRVRMDEGRKCTVNVAVTDRGKTFLLVRSATFTLPDNGYKRKVSLNNICCGLHHVSAELNRYFHRGIVISTISTSIYISKL